MVYRQVAGLPSCPQSRGEYVLAQGKDLAKRKKAPSFRPAGFAVNGYRGTLAFIEKLEKDVTNCDTRRVCPDINQLLIKKGGLFYLPLCKQHRGGKLRLLFELAAHGFLLWNRRRAGD